MQKTFKLEVKVAVIVGKTPQREEKGIKVRIQRNANLKGIGRGKSIHTV